MIEKHSAAVLQLHGNFGFGSELHLNRQCLLPCLEIKQWKPMHFHNKLNS